MMDFVVVAHHSQLIRSTTTVAPTETDKQQLYNRQYLEYSQRTGCKNKIVGRKLFVAWMYIQTGAAYKAHVCKHYLAEIAPTDAVEWGSQMEFRGHRRWLMLVHGVPPIENPPAHHYCCYVSLPHAPLTHGTAVQYNTECFMVRSNNGRPLSCSGCP